MDNPLYNSRLRSLHIVLVLSMIGSGLSFLSYLMTGFLLPTMKMMYYSGSMTFPSEMTVFIEHMLDTPRSFYFCGALLYGLSFSGVILMWQLHKSGFHLYTLAQLLIMLITILFLGRESPPLGEVMLTILFVVFYFITLRSINVFNPPAEKD